MVRRQQEGVAMAKHNGSLSHLGLRGHAATDPGQYDLALLSKFYRAFPRHSRPCRGKSARGSEVVGGHGILWPCRQSLQSRRDGYPAVQGDDFGWLWGIVHKKSSNLHQVFSQRKAIHSSRISWSTTEKPCSFTKWMNDSASRFRMPLRTS